MRARRPQVVRSAARGLTLLELVIAIAILTLASAGLMELSARSTHGNLRSKDEAAATALAVEKLEELKNRGYTSLAAGHDEITESGGTGSFTYSRDWAISGEHLVAGMPAKVLTVTVRWLPGGTVTYSTRMVNPIQPFQGRPAVVVQAWDQNR